MMSSNLKKLPQLLNQLRHKCVRSSAVSAPVPITWPRTSYKDTQRKLLVSYASHTKGCDTSDVIRHLGEKSLPSVCSLRK